MAPNASLIHGLIAQSVRKCEWNAVAVGSDLTQANVRYLLLKNPSVVNIVCISSFCYTNVITSARF